MKKITAVLAVVLVVCLLSGCAGTPVVYYSDCTCPVDSHVQEVPATQPENTTPPASSEPQIEVTQAPVVPEGAVKTGLAILATVAASEPASADTEGKAVYEVNIAVVTVDENGVIVSCIIDSVGTELKFSAEGQLPSELPEEVLTKTELGEAYGMKNSGFQYEWYEQAQALADYAVGKTVEQLRAGAVNESGKAADADLAAMASIRLGGYVDAIEAAVANAQYLGAQADDELKMAVICSLGDSKSANPEEEGVAQLNVDVAAITMDGEVITSCMIDSVQAKVAFDASGVITSDVTAPVLTKNELGENYGMKAWAGAKFEWNEQAANFAAYVTGKTADEVAGIAIDEGTKPTDADLAASVTIAIGGFQALIAKAVQE